MNEKEQFNQKKENLQYIIDFFCVATFQLYCDTNTDQ